jgi:hypothetical protein
MTRNEVRIRLQTAIKVATQTLGNRPFMECQIPDYRAWCDLRSRTSHGETPSAVVDVVDVLKMATRSRRLRGSRNKVAFRRCNIGRLGYWGAPRITPQ